MAPDCSGKAWVMLPVQVLHDAYFASAGSYLMCRPCQFWPALMARDRGRWASEPVVTRDGEGYARSTQRWVAASATPCGRGAAGSLP